MKWSISRRPCWTIPAVRWMRRWGVFIKRITRKGVGMMIVWRDNKNNQIIRFDFRIAHQRVQAAEGCGRLGLLFTVSGGSHRDKRGLQRSNEISIYGHRETTHSASQNDHFLPRYSLSFFFFFYIVIHAKNEAKMYIFNHSSRIILCMGHTFHRPFRIYGYV